MCPIYSPSPAAISPSRPNLSPVQGRSRSYFCCSPRFICIKLVPVKWVCAAFAGSAGSGEIWNGCQENNKYTNCKAWHKCHSEIPGSERFYCARGRLGRKVNLCAAMGQLSREDPFGSASRLGDRRCAECHFIGNSGKHMDQNQLYIRSNDGC